MARAAHAGLKTASEAFSDRRYDADGHLLPRGHDGAVIDKLEDVLRQALTLATEHRVKLADGDVIELHADTLCVHGDRSDAAELARGLHKGLQAAGVSVAPLD